MYTATLEFHGALNDFLPRRRRDGAFSHKFDGQPSIKDMIESVGVPHTEIEMIVVNDEGVDFHYLVRDGDHIVAYPARMETATMTHLRVRPEPPTPRRFVLDQHLGRLAAYLRMLGFDTLYRNDYHDEELAQTAADQERILLTRDVGLLKRGIVRHGYFVRATNPEKQIREVISYYDLLPHLDAFRRCAKCNGTLIDVEKELVSDRLPPMADEYFDHFRICKGCQQVYWRGSHVERVEKLIEDLQAPE
jgi:uncharacterized protein